MKQTMFNTMWPIANKNLVNLSNSILQEMGISPYTSTLKELDEIFQKKNYKNIVLLLYDGMGSSILNRYLENNAFLPSHKLCDISSVFPATTVAATNSVLTGLEPSEHGWLGWDMYFKDDDETVSVFKNTLKDSDFPSKHNSKNRPEMHYKTILDRINTETEYDAYWAWPFNDEHPCHTLEEIRARILSLCDKSNKKFIYAYYHNPDHLMHENGLKSQIVEDEMLKINSMTEELYQEIPENSIIVVVADHGHIACEYKTLSDYPELYDMLARTTAIETRACAIKLKEHVDKRTFKKLFLQEFENNFILYSKKEIIKHHLFGKNIKNEIVMDNFADYIAIAIHNVCLRYDENGKIFKTAHAGITVDEMMVPLIVIEK